VAVELGQDVPLVLVKDVATNLPIGPHAIRLSTNEVFPISRLVEDSHDTMIGGSITTECHPSSYEWLPLEVRSSKEINTHPTHRVLETYCTAI